MNITLNLKKGLDLKIAGAVADKSSTRPSTAQASSVAIVPDDYRGLTLKPLVKEGDEVHAGTPILGDKKNTDIVVCAPIPGTVEAIVRGDRRKLERIVIKPAATTEPAVTNPVDFSKSSAQDCAKSLQQSGLWALMRQRPYNIVPDPALEPRDIFITTFDSAPLAPDFDDLLALKATELETAVSFLSKLTHGKIYISRRSGSSIPDIKGATMVDIKGPHPAGNVGIQIANIAPVNKGQTVWTLDGVTAVRIGHYLLTGRYDGNCKVALTGSEVIEPCYIETTMGADIASLINGRIKESTEHKRIISGNVLTGTAVGSDGYLRWPFTQITVIPEGDDKVEFMGWATLSPAKMSTSRSFPGHFLHKLFNPDARLLGGRRAMIMSGEYDKLIPMDIMTEYLVKAIVSRDIEKMEQLGIYEIAPEDVALAEYACTSKMPLQAIVNDGLEYLRKELE